MRMKYRVVLITSSILIAIFLLWQIEMSHESQVDACLDNGGSFNYQSCSCDYKMSHEFLVDHICE